MRELAKRSEDAAQTRRLLALAAIYEGGARSEAAKIGGVGLQTVRDWVLAFNAVGPSGLVNRKAPGNTPLLNEAQRRALARIVEEGPVPAAHGVVRWRLMSAFIRGCDKLRGAFPGCTLLVIHHTGWEAAHERGNSSLRGASRVFLARIKRLLTPFSVCTFTPLAAASSPGFKPFGCALANAASTFSSFRSPSFALTGASAASSTMLLVSETFTASSHSGL
ncbi:MAG: helix-turn-helix domain-containing protein [Acidobacteria bacterium]|nr:helix-turn-helix domain-containing protein [Acidobacteriota bacterium]